MNQIAEELRLLEESLWVATTRFDRSYMEQIFSDDFFEFGRSGRVYSREECLDVGPRQVINATIPLPSFKVRALDEVNFFVTYVSEVRRETLEKANRASLWTKTSVGWKLRFHQGTPTI